ncbi:MULTISPECIES: hypothetical protein [Phyllobacteriaceae]|uniref:hypothetical protein n=1 Tax=Phyllobacteriaceae TaxID=69277 RepID=UPI0005CA9CF9|nr:MULTISPECIES: hypothetical protein [Phyllobacteriaceae]BBD36408.1 hypothetical protein Amn_12880 [Aminobacter sp. SS-2016]
MAAAIGSGFGNISLARRGHGDPKSQPEQPDKPGSGNDDPNKPGSGNNDPNKPVGGKDPVDGQTISGDDQQALAEAFDTVLHSVALTILNDAMADADEAIAETEEDA